MTDQAAPPVAIVTGGTGAIGPATARRLAAFLVSPDAGWITGQIVGADGGLASIRLPVSG